MSTWVGLVATKAIAGQGATILRMVMRGAGQQYLIRKVIRT